MVVGLQGRRFRIVAGAGGFLVLRGRCFWGVCLGVDCSYGD